MLERACNAYKTINILKTILGDVPKKYAATPRYPEDFFDTLKHGQNEKLYIFQEMGI